MRVLLPTLKHYLIAEKKEKWSNEVVTSLGTNQLAVIHWNLYIVVTHGTQLNPQNTYTSGAQLSGFSSLYPCFNIIRRSWFCIVGYGNPPGN